MSRRAAASIAALVASLGAPRPAAAWGFAAHRIVAESATEAMPAELAHFYRSGRTALSSASIEPDSILKERDGEVEKRRHYIDLEELGRPPFEGFPTDEATARRRFGDELVESAGTLPWRVVEVHRDLVRALRAGDWTRAIQLSGWLSHYVADAFQPLHTTGNHDGQKTCNHGIHAAFETDLIDRSKSVYRAAAALPAGFRAEAIEDPGAFIVAAIREAHTLVREILSADTAAVRAVKRERSDYYEELERRAGPLARAQIKGAAAACVSLCWSAWVGAGRPALPVRSPSRTGGARGGRP